MTHHNHSHANGSNWTFENPSFRSTARGTSGATCCSIVVQTNAVFARSVLDAVRRFCKKGLHGISIHAVASESDEETFELIGTLRHQSDVFALLGKNTERLKAALLELRSLHIPVIALVSDLDPSVRTTYIGSDNRAAGQLAGFIFGRSLERELGAQVAIVACNLAYRCWEDREIGFRSLLRQRFPQISIVEVVMEKVTRPKRLARRPCGCLVTLTPLAESTIWSVRVWVWRKRSVRFDSLIAHCTSRMSWTK
jgi:ABC-type sugar transport system substrate-binding protein